MPTLVTGYSVNKMFGSPFHIVLGRHVCFVVQYVLYLYGCGLPSWLNHMKDLHNVNGHVSVHVWPDLLCVAKIYDVHKVKGLCILDSHYSEKEIIFKCIMSNNGKYLG